MTGHGEEPVKGTQVADIDGTVPCLDAVEPRWHWPYPSRRTRRSMRHTRTNCSVEIGSLGGPGAAKRRLQKAGAGPLLGRHDLKPQKAHDCKMVPHVRPNIFKIRKDPPNEEKMHYPARSARILHDPHNCIGWTNCAREHVGFPHLREGVIPLPDSSIELVPEIHSARLILVVSESLRLPRDRAPAEESERSMLSPMEQQRRGSRVSKAQKPIGCLWHTRHRPVDKSRRM